MFQSWKKIGHLTHNFTNYMYKFTQDTAYCRVDCTKKFRVNLMRNLNAKKQEKRKIRIFYSSNEGGIICVNWLRFVNFLITRIFFSCAEVFIKITNDFLLYRGFLSQDTINSKIQPQRQIEIEFLWDSNYTSLDPWPYWDCSWKNLFSETQHQRWKCHHIKRNNLQFTDTEPFFFFLVKSAN